MERINVVDGKPKAIGEIGCGRQILPALVVSTTRRPVPVKASSALSETEIDPPAVGTRSSHSRAGEDALECDEVEIVGQVFDIELAGHGNVVVEVNSLPNERFKTVCGLTKPRSKFTSSRIFAGNSPANSSRMT